MTMITPSYLGETIEYSSLHACRSTLEDPTDAAQVKAIWSKILFTGRGVPPKQLLDSAAVKKAVAANPKAVGYIEKSAVDASVKVVMPLS